MKEQLLNKINTIFSAKGGMGKIPNWFAKETLKDVIDYGEKYTTNVAQTKQNKSSFVTVNTEGTVELSPNTYTEIESIVDNLTLYLKNTIDGTIPTYNAHFTLGNVSSELDFNVDSELGNLFWAHKAAIKSFTEYSLFVNGNMAWLCDKPLVVFEVIYDVGLINQKTPLLSIDSKTGNTVGDLVKKAIIEGKSVGAVSDYQFSSKGDQKIYLLFERFPDLASCFKNISNIKEINFYFIGEELNINNSNTFYDNSMLESVSIGDEGSWTTDNASYMFYNCKNLSDSSVNELLQKITNNSKAVKVNNMFDGCPLLDCVDMSNWDCDASSILGSGSEAPSQITFKSNTSPFLLGSSYFEEGSKYSSSSGPSLKTKIVDLSKGDLPYKDLTFYSEDRIVASYTKEEALALTELPQEPVHSDYLEFNGWGITLEEIQDKIRLYGYYNAIARYTNTRNYHFFDISLATNSLTIEFGSNDTSVDVDWGDGSDIETVENVSRVNHIYPYEYGRWDIKIYPKSDILNDISFSSQSFAYYSTSSFTLHDKARFYGKNYYVTSIGLSSYKINNFNIELTFPDGSKFIEKEDNIWGPMWQFGRIFSYYETQEIENYDINVYLTSIENAPEFYNFKVHRAEYINGLNKVRYASPILPNDATSIYITNDQYKIQYGYGNNLYHDTNVVAMAIPDSVTSVHIESLYIEALNLPANVSADLSKCVNLNFIDNYNNPNIILGNAMHNLRYAWFPITNNELTIDGFKRLKNFSTDGSAINNLTIKNCYQLSELPNIKNVSNIVIYKCPQIKNFDLLPTYSTCSVDNCVNLETVTLYDGITTLNASFQDNPKLHYVNFPEGLTTIGDYAFDGSNLYELNLPSTIKNIGEGAFRNNLISDLNLPEGIQVIEADTFAHLVDLEELVIPNSVNRIETQAFTGDTSNSILKKVTLPNALTYVGSNAFPTTVTHVDIPDLQSWLNIEFESLTFGNSTLYISGNELITATIPDDVTELKNTVHFGKSCKNLELGAGVNTINTVHIHGFDSLSVNPNNTTFDSRDNCNSIIETESNTLLFASKNTIIPDSVVTIGPNAFDELPNLKVTLSDSIVSVEKGAFENNTISGGKNLKHIGQYAFNYCNIQNLNLSNVTSIDANAFGSTEISEINLPLVEVIPDSAFYYTEAEKITFGPNTKSIGKTAFSGASNIKELVCLATTAPTVESNTFSGITNLTATLYYPKGSDYSSWITLLSPSETVTWTFVEIE